MPVAACHLSCSASYRERKKVKGSHLQGEDGLAWPRVRERSIAGSAARQLAEQLCFEEGAGCGGAWERSRAGKECWLLCCIEPARGAAASKAARLRKPWRGSRCSWTTGDQ